MIGYAESSRFTDLLKTSMKAPMVAMVVPFRRDMEKLPD